MVEVVDSDVATATIGSYTFFLLTFITRSWARTISRLQLMFFTTVFVC